MTLISPWPYFGGKSRPAPLVWERFGDVPNYTEPFVGTGAVLLARPDAHVWWDRIETVNDKDGFIPNYWRAVKADPDAVAHHADWPVSECDLFSRHSWLVSQRDTMQAQLEGDPDWYDAKIAGWWVWGMCSWIGSGWCSGSGPWHVVDGLLVREPGHEGIGGSRGMGIKRQLPHLGTAGQGINRKLPHLGTAGQGLCAEWSSHLRGIMQALSDRLRRVRVCCGDWSRICGPSPTIKLGLTGVFLDPPYDQTMRDAVIYNHETPCSDAVREWALAHGDDPLMRICLCGYEGEHDMPATWEKVAWKARGGYSNLGDAAGKLNSHLERLWFSPHCLRPDRRGGLMAMMDAEEPEEEEGK